MRYVYLFILYILITCNSVQAQTSPSPADPTQIWGEPFVAPSIADKSDYWLLNPVPADQMRAFSTDRPGKTHSSTTVDAGHFQVESDFFNYTYDRNSPHDQTTETFSFGNPIFKVGVTQNIDLEAGFSFYNRTRLDDRLTGLNTYGNGFGDISLGSKINIFGNEGGRQALAVIPFIKIPTAAQNVGNGVTEYTVNAPYTVELDNLWSLTLEPALGFLKNADNNNLHGDYSFLANINRPVFVKTITAALEIASEYSSDPQIGPRYTLDPSLQWLVTPVLQLDVGIYLGLNRAAPDYNPYTGISYRY